MTLIRLGIGSPSSLADSASTGTQDVLVVALGLLLLGVGCGLLARSAKREGRSGPALVVVIALAVVVAALSVVAVTGDGTFTSAGMWGIEPCSPSGVGPGAVTRHPA